MRKEFAISTGRIQFDKFIKYVLEDWNGNSRDINQHGYTKARYKRCTHV